MRFKPNGEGFIQRYAMLEGHTMTGAALIKYGIIIIIIIIIINAVNKWGPAVTTLLCLVDSAEWIPWKMKMKTTVGGEFKDT